MSTFTEYASYTSLRTQLAELAIEFEFAAKRLPNLSFQLFELSDGNPNTFWPKFVEANTTDPETERWEPYPLWWSNTPSIDVRVTGNVSGLCGRHFVADDRIEQAHATFVCLASRGFRVLDAVSRLDTDAKPTGCCVDVQQSEHRAWLDFLLTMGAVHRTALLDISQSIMGFPKDPQARLEAWCDYNTRWKRAKESGEPWADSVMVHELALNVFRSSRTAIAYALRENQPTPLGNRLWAREAFRLPPTETPDPVIALLEGSSTSRATTPSQGATPAKKRKPRGRPRNHELSARNQMMLEAHENAEFQTYVELGKQFGLGASAAGKIVWKLQGGKVADKKGRP